MLRLSPEDSLLVLTCRPFLSSHEDQAIKRLAEGEVKWAYVLWKAEYHRTLTLLEYHLRRLLLMKAVPTEIAAYLKRWTLLSRLRSLVEFQNLAPILDAFEVSGIASFLFKGADLALLYYPDPLLRPMQDLDLMINAVDAERAQRMMFDLGFRNGIFNPSNGEWTEVPRTLTPDSLLDTYELPVLVRVVSMESPLPKRLVPRGIRYKHVKCYIDACNKMRMPIFVDLHFNLSVGIDVEDVWRGMRLAKALGRVVRVQSVTGALWFLAARLYHEAFLYNTLRLLMFGELHTLLHTCRDEIDWSELVAIAYKYEMRPALYYVFTQVQQLTDAAIPPGVLDILKPEPTEIPLQHDWGDVIPKLLSVPHVSEVSLA